MFDSRWPLRILCLLLVCIFCFTSVVQPIRVQALDPFTLAAIGVPLVLVLPYLVGALGLAPTSESSTSFDQLISSISAGLDPALTYINDAGQTMLKIASAGMGPDRWLYLKEAFVDAVLGFMVAEGTVALANATPLYHPANFVLGGTNYAMCSSECFTFTRKTSNIGGEYLIVSADPNAVFYKWDNWKDPNNQFGPAKEVSHSSIVVDGITYSYIIYSTWFSDDDFARSYDGRFTEEVISALISTHTGLNVGEVGVDLQDPAYETWVGDSAYTFGGSNDGTSSGSGDDSGGDDGKLLPLKILGPTINLITTPQSDLQKPGPSNITEFEELNESIEVDPDTIPEELKNTDTDTDTDPDTNPDTGTGTEIKTDYTTWFQQIISYFGNVYTTLQNGFASVIEFFSNLDFAAAVERIISTIGSIPQKLFDWFELQFTNIGSWISTQTASITQAIQDLGNKFKKPDSSGFEPKPLPSLKEFFPFCIPFDLHAMLSALQAAPVAPSFTFAIPFAGKLYEFTIDLSSWSGVASMLRTCQVALFCFGLTKLTQRVIKW